MCLAWLHQSNCSGLCPWAGFGFWIFIWLCFGLAVRASKAEQREITTIKGLSFSNFKLYNLCFSPELKVQTSGKKRAVWRNRQWLGLPHFVLVLQHQGECAVRGVQLWEMRECRRHGQEWHTGVYVEWGPSETSQPDTQIQRISEAIYWSLCKSLCQNFFMSESSSCWLARFHVSIFSSSVNSLLLSFCSNFQDQGKQKV